VLTSFGKTQATLRAYITNYVTLTFPRADGSKLKDHLAKLIKESTNPAIPLSMRESFAIQAKEHTAPDINTYEHWLLSRFWELDTGRRQGPHGPEPIGFGDIAAYVVAFNEELEPIEVQILKSIDCSYLDAVFSEQRKQHEV